MNRWASFQNKFSTYWVVKWLTQFGSCLYWLDYFKMYLKLFWKTNIVRRTSSMFSMEGFKVTTSSGSQTMNTFESFTPNYTVDKHLQFGFNFAFNIYRSLLFDKQSAKAPIYNSIYSVIYNLWFYNISLTVISRLFWTWREFNYMYMIHRSTLKF